MFTILARRRERVQRSGRACTHLGGPLHLRRTIDEQGPRAGTRRARASTDDGPSSRCLTRFAIEPARTRSRARILTRPGSHAGSRPGSPAEESPS
eukprot:9053088-Pyramimonas_sp.AAC.2